MAEVWANSMACHSRATCHTAGCCHLANSMSWFQSYVSHRRVLPPGEFNSISSQSHVSHCMVLPLSEFTVTIPAPHATLQGAVIRRNQCHDRATLQGVRISYAIIENRFSPYFILFYFLMQFRLWRAAAFVSSPIQLLLWLPYWMTVVCTGVSALRCRLSGTPATQHEGRLEVYHKHSWRPVCDNMFGDIEARVVCFSLGFPKWVLTLYSAKTVFVLHRITWSWYIGRWWVGCYIWYSEEGKPAQFPLRCTKCNSPPINGQRTKHRVACTAVYCSAVSVCSLKG